ncbi:hypothetical protein ACOMHN_043114 [Nucella lapillus]
MTMAVSAGLTVVVVVMVAVLLVPVPLAVAADSSSSNREADSPPHYLNSFAVQVDGGLTEAQAVASDLGFSVQRELPNIDVYLLEHPSLSERSKRSADHHLSRLKDHPKVRYVQQEVELKRVKRSIIHDKQLELPIREIKDNSVFHRVKLSSKSLRNFKDGVVFNDPFFKDMWYLENRGQSGGEMYLDMNVQVAWAKGFSGEGVVVCILDDGVDHSHPDLMHNYDPKASADLNDKSDRKHDPMPDMTNPANSHGTRCAGEIAASANNDVCGVGVAYNAKIGGIRILDGMVTDSLEGEALAFNRDYVDIFSASWGPNDNGFTMEGPNYFAAQSLRSGVLKGGQIYVYPNDDGFTMEAPNYFAAQSLRSGVLKGRHGLGNIFVWATGNGGMNGDDCNADGYTSRIETLSVGSITDRGRQPFYMENCTSTLAVVPTGGEEYLGQEQDMGQIKLKVVTTDAGGGCIENFQGTSSAAPLAAGCIANVLQANPSLTWRDVQHVVVHGTRVPSVDSSWTINGGGHHVSHKFGFGLMDCGKMVQVAQNWHNVPEQHVCSYNRENLMKIGYDGSVIDKISVDACKGDNSKWIQRLEHVQVHLKVNSRRRGDIQVFLVSPSGTRSELLSRRALDSFKGQWAFTFMTVHSWDENPKGTWQLEIQDKPKKPTTSANSPFSELTALSGFSHEDAGGFLQGWSLTLYGTAGERYGRDFSSKRTRTKAFHPSEETVARIKRNETVNARSVQVKRASTSKRQNKPTEENGQGSEGSIDSLAARLTKLLKRERQNYEKRILKEGNSFTARKKENLITTAKKSQSYKKRKELKVVGKSEASDDQVLVKVLRSLEQLLAEEKKKE